MIYIITTQTEKGILFLADRNKTKEYWWTKDWYMAFKYFNKEAANKRALEFTNPPAKVITLDEAKKIYPEQIVL